MQYNHKLIDKSNKKIHLTKLYRPVGIHELQKISCLGLKSFPKRLSWQPIFYPVLNLEYAIQIAKEWNINDINSGYCGFVTSFHVNTEYLKKYKVEQVGGDIHREYWIPSESLHEFNSNIIGNIEVIDSYYGEKYTGEKLDFKNKTIEQQIDFLESLF